MSDWNSHSIEEKSLLNPSFCSILLWHAASAYTNIAGTPLSLDLAFLVLPVVLHRETRELLPKTTATSLAVWLDENPLVRSRIAENARATLTYTKNALMFGGLHGLLNLAGGNVAAQGDWRRKISAELRTANEEVRSCAKRAEFMGTWFARTGNPGTVLALLGVKP